MNQDKIKTITIIGGGPAGLSAGYYAKLKNLQFKILEFSDKVGGNSQTIRFGDFYVDTGAHRFHDKDNDATRIIKKLLGKNLTKVNMPTQIFYNGQFVDFPLSPLNLLKSLGVGDFLKATIQIITQKFKKHPSLSFEDAMINKYGILIASKFLLNYSEKLWGLPCNKLSPSVAGTRLAGLDFKTLLLEIIMGNQKKTKHLDGDFYYPKYGIGMISDIFAKKIGLYNIKTESRITKIFHNNKKIKSLQVNNKDLVDVDLVINTISIKSFVLMMNPTPPKNIIDIANNLKFRNVKIVIFLLNKDTITKSATIHFPDLKIPFTRVYEPRNRSNFMSPKGKTSIVVEFPYGTNEKKDEKKSIDIARKELIKIGLFEEKDIISTHTYDVENAYPVLEKKFEEKIEKILKYLEGFDNLYSSGRSGLFKYSWIHNQIKSGKDTLDKISD